MDMTPPLPIADARAAYGRDRRLLEAIQQGLPLAPRPYAAIGARLGMTEHEVVRRLERLLTSGVIKRLGVVVRHHELGYGANAMVVWDVPDERAGELGRRLSAFEFVTLCYRRGRSLPEWRYNLYCMIHGRDRDTVRAHIARLIEVCGLTEAPHAVLFSRRRFKQCGANYRCNASGRS
jgi:DNA-binding Lrp family transcriptional regulator